MSVINLFTKKPLTDLDRRPDATEELEELGIYCGKLPNNVSNTLRDTSKLLEAKRVQINQLIAEYDELASYFNECCLEGAKYLQMPKLADMEKDKQRILFVGDDGHAWLILPEDRERFNMLLGTRLESNVKN